MNIYPLNHSGVLVLTDKRAFLFDYTGGELPDFSVPLTVFVSHAHDDHYDKRIFDLGADEIILSSDIPVQDKTISIAAHATHAHTDYQLRTVGSTDEGVAFLLDTEGLRFFFAGDLNDWYWPDEDTHEEMVAMERAFRKEIDRIEYADYIFFPVDPRLGNAMTKGLDYAVKTLHPRAVLPIHTWGEDARAEEAVAKTGATVLARSKIHEITPVAKRIPIIETGKVRGKEDPASKHELTYQRSVRIPVFDMKDIKKAVEWADKHAHQPERTTSVELPVWNTKEIPCVFRENKETSDVPKILLTGFEPFDGETENPSGLIVRAFAGEQRENLVTAVLPVAFDRAAETLRALIETHRPDRVVLLGQAGGRNRVTAEMVAVNFRDARIPDNDGKQPCRERILEGAPDAYLSTAPVHALVDRIRADGIPAAVSMTAGTYVCNELYFSALHAMAGHGETVFVHLPYLPAQATEKDAPSMDLATMRRAVEHLL